MTEIFLFSWLKKYPFKVLKDLNKVYVLKNILLLNTFNFKITITNQNKNLIKIFLSKFLYLILFYVNWFIFINRLTLRNYPMRQLVSTSMNNLYI